MLAMTQVSNTTTNVYTCPSNSTAYVFMDIVSPNAQSVSLTVSVGNGSTFYTYWTGYTNFISLKLVLTGGDIIRVSTTDTVNVFVSGQLG
jgi:hypothetical protein